MPSMCTGPGVSSRTFLAIRNASTTPWQYPRGVILTTSIPTSLRGGIWWHDQPAMAVATLVPGSPSGREVQARQVRRRRFAALILDTIFFSVISLVVNNVYGVTVVTSGAPLSPGRDFA